MRQGEKGGGGGHSGEAAPLPQQGQFQRYTPGTVALREIRRWELAGRINWHMYNLYLAVDVSPI